MSDLVERHQAKIEAITGACSCHDGFKSRGLIAPDCMFHECSHDIAELFDRIEALENAIREWSTAGNSTEAAVAAINLRRALEAK